MPDVSNIPDAKGMADAPQAPSGVPGAEDVGRLANELFRSSSNLPTPPSAQGSRGVPKGTAAHIDSVDSGIIHGPAADDGLAGAVGSLDRGVGSAPISSSPKPGQMPNPEPLTPPGGMETGFYFLEEGMGQASGTAEIAARAAAELTAQDLADPYSFGKVANEMFGERWVVCGERVERAQSRLGLKEPPTPESMPGQAEAPPAQVGPSSGGLDVESVRRDFPILHRKVNGRPLIWLDNAATTQKPQAVIDRISKFYAEENSNIHRGAHLLAAAATDAYEAARTTVQRFLGAASPKEIIFVRGTTEAVNLVAQSLGRSRLGPGDEIVLTQLEHHSNIIPWQFVAKETGAFLRVAPVNDRGELMLDAYARLLGPRTRIVAVTQVSNALGTVLPVREMTDMAHRHGAVVLVDGAQGVPHFAVNVQEIGCDFYAFSGHKLFGPTGVGVLYGRKALLDEMPPWQGGGSMIDRVTFEESTFAPVPAKFEAGTGILAGAVGLGAAIDYVTRLGPGRIERYEAALMKYAADGLATVPGLRPIGTAQHKAGAHSFVLEGSSSREVGEFLDTKGIAVRAGHHCAQPTMDRFGVDGTVRPSLAFYNTRAEIDSLVDALKEFQGVRR